jgi:hypothetical protein
VNGKKPTQVTKSKVAENLFPVPCSLVITTIFNANLLNDVRKIFPSADWEILPNTNN